MPFCDALRSDFILYLVKKIYFICIFGVNDSYLSINLLGSQKQI